jgi:hypothetical protein
MVNVCSDVVNAKPKLTVSTTIAWGMTRYLGTYAGWRQHVFG